MSEPSLAPGTKVGPYEILALLGQGGMGAVYKAKDPRLSREVALKVLLEDVASDPDRLRRFADEARAASLLSHPNIVTVYDIGDHSGAPYIISELLQGETLRDRLSAGALPARKAIEYGVQILRGLAAAHDKGIVHRDLKPENVFLTKGGLVKILDFGIAKLSPHGEGVGSEVETRSHTDAGTLIGTVGYMSPEQVRALSVDHRSDLFSFGAVLYEMLTGKRAFKGMTPADTLSAILREDPTEALSDGPVLPASLVRVVRRSLEKSPDDRFQNSRDLAFALEGATTESSVAPAEIRSLASGRRGATLLRAAAVLTLIGLAHWAGRSMVPTQVPVSFRRLTFRVGNVVTARFAPDGETILYSAKWGNSPIELFSTRAATRGERSLALTDALVLAVSARDEMALLLRPQIYAVGDTEGMLARAPLAGGAAPREILEGVLGADWSPDGKDLAVVHVVGESFRLEYPIGHVLYAPDPPAWISGLRVSPTGDQVAFVENPLAHDNRGGISMVDRAGQRKALASDFASVLGLGWSPNGDEVWFGASRTGGATEQIRAVSRSGRQRLIMEVPGNFAIRDVSRRGQVLGALVSGGSEVHARARGATEEAELPATNFSFPSDLSDDGRQILGTDVGEDGGPNFRSYLQKTDGSPAVWLGDGDGQALSPDGRFALAVLLHTQPQQLVIVPTGAGETRTLDPGPVVVYSRAVWDSTGRQVVFSGADKHDSSRVYVQDVAGGLPKAVTPDGVSLGKIGRPVSPDGQRVVALGPDEVPALYPLAGGEPVAIPGLDKWDGALCWTPDGRELLVARYAESGAILPRVERIEIASGRARPWNGLGHATPDGLEAARILVTPDGKSYAYGYVRQRGDLYVTSSLR